MRPGPAQNESAPTLPRRRDDACRPEDHGSKRPRSCTSDLTIVRRQRQRLSFFRRGSERSIRSQKDQRSQWFSGISEAGRSDGRSSPPAVSAAYLSAVSRSVKAERAGNIEVFGRFQRTIRRAITRVWKGTPSRRRRPNASDKCTKRPPNGGLLYLACWPPLFGRRQAAGCSAAAAWRCFRSFRGLGRLLLALVENELVALAGDFRSEFIMAPVPAGIRRPTITFSLRPRACRPCR